MLLARSHQNKQSQTFMTYEPQNPTKTLHHKQQPTKKNESTRGRKADCLARHLHYLDLKKDRESSATFRSWSLIAIDTSSWTSMLTGVALAFRRGSTDSKGVIPEAKPGMPC